MHACVFDGLMGMWIWRQRTTLWSSFFPSTVGHQALSPAEQFALGVRVTMFLKMTQGNTLQKERVPVCIYIHRITRLHTILGLVI